ncbi:MAG: carboxypeptidase-like regulatory domain-containing protein [Vicinamibacterales bacterium]
MRRSIARSMIVLVVASVATIAVVRTQARQTASAPVPIDPDDIGGVVAGPSGPEAGVWVIAETNDLPTKFRKIVVTDDRGRYVLPDLPKAKYQIWVRGYGLIDSAHVEGSPGSQLDLTAVTAPNPQAAAQIYPANYWYSLMRVPPKSDFPGTGPRGNGIGTEMLSQAHWISEMKSNCHMCHQIGTKATRELPRSLGVFDSSFKAWEHRIQIGQDAAGMINSVNAMGRDRALAAFADWTDRISAGEVPPAPPRPQGIERNVVITTWDWGSPASFVHHEISTDKRNPTVNANGPYYGMDWSMDKLLVLDPKTHTATEIPMPTTESTPYSKSQTMPRPSPYWGEEVYWSGRAQPGVATMDERGRIWTTQAVRSADNPAWCKEGSSNVFAQYFPLPQNRKHLSMYDPQTKKVTLIDMCARGHHLNFHENDGERTLYLSGYQNPTFGWLKTRMFDRTGDAVRSQGWCPAVIDYNGDGVIGKWTEPDRPPDPKLDRRVTIMGYGIAVSPVDGSAWLASPLVPGSITRLDVGSNPPATCRAEIYEPPFNNAKVPNQNGYIPRGIDVDGNGVVWTALAGSGHLASFDRRKCAVLNGPTATGQHCPEGWTLHPTPGPTYKGVTDEVSSEYHYDNWVDRFNTLGLGTNVPLAAGSASDSLLALQPNGQWVRMRVPYPLGFFMRGMDGRIDDPRAGWKGRSMHSNYGPNSIWHAEGGKGARSALVKFQIRPDPLAK